METYSVDLPTLFGDHHVMEVRRILLEIPGIQSVYASSCFHIVEVKFDPVQVRSDTIEERLHAAGYLGDLAVPQERSQSAENNESERPFMRHTAIYEQTRSTVAFAQEVQPSGRALWPCPGLGILRDTTEVGEN